ncbi:MAG: rRNA maturation RNase YbeY [Alphaproteobacteria bacterium]|nr:rRNA maturation RNase YbeY [Alphaproteobacteria bacterium]
MNADIRVDILDPRWRKRLPNAEQLVRASARAALDGASRGAVTFALADDDFLRALNRDFRGKDKATNVLSFAAGGDELGDVALALETCAREARAQHKDLSAHVRHLVVHGALHLLGFDHERVSDAFAMEARERRVLRRLGVSDPYRVRGAA